MGWLVGLLVAGLFGFAVVAIVLIKEALNGSD